MRSATLPSFWEAYRSLDEEVKGRARRVFRLWAENPFHPSLRFKCVNREENVWSVRITHGRPHHLEAEIVAPGVPMPTVDAAAAAMRVAPEQIFKSILFQAGDGRCVLVVASGNGRIDLSSVETMTGLSGLRLAKPGVARAMTGYSPGGTPPVGHRERVPVIVDARVAAQEWGYAGGGRPELLVKIKAADIIRLTGATVHDVIQDSQGL